MSIFNAWQRLRRRLDSVPRADLEHSGVRFAAMMGYWVFLMFVPEGGYWNFERHDAYVSGVFTIVASLALFAWLLIAPEVSTPRRYCGMFVDVASCTWCVLIGAEYGFVLYGSSLWSIIAFGLRFGKRYMRAAMAMHLTGFSVALYFTPFWQEHLQLGIALLAILYLIPRYVEKLLDRHTRATQAAEEANAAKGRFVATISHEIRTPLNGIIATNDLLQRTALSPAQQELVGALEVSSRHLLRLVNDVLQLARIEAGKLEVHLRPFRPAAIVAEVGMSLRPLAVAKGLHFETRFDTGSDDICMGDPDSIRQVLLNLGGNAIKFTPAGHVRITVRVSQRDTKGPVLQFLVEDTGPGIPLEQQQAIFEPFVQIASSPGRRYPGTGLGTSIAKNLVQLMGGQIRLESELDRGTAFHVELPWQPAPAGTSAPHRLFSVNEQEHGVSECTSSEPDRPAELVQARGEAGHVLLIEDNEINRMVQCRMLEGAGYTVRLAPDGSAGLCSLACREFPLVILDLDMPGLGGLDVVAWFKRIAPSRRAPAWIVVTGHATPQMEHRVAAAGVTTFLTKPIVYERLVHASTTASRSASPHPARRQLLDEERLIAHVSDGLGGVRFLQSLADAYQRDGAALLEQARNHVLADDLAQVWGDLHALAGIAAEIGDLRTAYAARRLLEGAPMDPGRIISALNALQECHVYGRDSLFLFVAAAHTLDGAGVKQPLSVSSGTSGAVDPAGLASSVARTCPPTHSPPGRTDQRRNTETGRC